MIMITIFLLSMSHAVHSSVVTQYIRNSFSKRMVDKATLEIKACSYFGAILGCTIAFIIIAEIVPDFNTSFLTIKVDRKARKDHHINSGTDDLLRLDYHDTIESFQITVGCFMIALSLVQILNTYFRFYEMSDSDRERFANCQLKARMDFREKILQESIQNYTLISVNDLDILKCQKPNSKDLMLALLQKFIFDLLLGVWLATAGLNLFTVYDFITFGETLESIMHADKTELKKFKVHQFNFVLQGDAKLSMVIFTACILAIFVSFFASFTIYQGMLSKERLIKIRNEHLIHLSFFFGLVGFLLLLNSEDYQEKELQR